MATMPILQRATLEAWTDEDVIRRVLAGETGAFEVIMRRYNGLASRRYLLPGTSNDLGFETVQKKGAG